MIEIPIKMAWMASTIMKAFRLTLLGIYLEVALTQIHTLKKLSSMMLLSIREIKCVVMLESSFKLVTMTLENTQNKWLIWIKDKSQLKKRVMRTENNLRLTKEV